MLDSKHAKNKGLKEKSSHDFSEELSIFFKKKFIYRSSFFVKR
jgi:hypothetical protein